jgi:hypothetical protein
MPIEIHWRLIENSFGGGPFLLSSSSMKQNFWTRSKEKSFFHQEKEARL